MNTDAFVDRLVALYAATLRAEIHADPSPAVLRAEVARLLARAALADPSIPELRAALDAWNPRAPIVSSPLQPGATRAT